MTAINIILLVFGLYLLFFLNFRIFRMAYLFNLIISISLIVYLVYPELDLNYISELSLYLGCPLLLGNTIFYVFHQDKRKENLDRKYQVTFKTNKGDFSINNIRRGVSIIGSAGSGKTESLVHGFLKHYSNYSFSGVIHDYKDFELTEMAYPVFKRSQIPFYIVSFDKIVHRVNPIAPRYLENEESVNEISRVLIENLLEQKDTGATGTNKFFNDAAEGLIGGLIWKLKTSYPQFCTLPHLIMILQLLDTESLIAFLETNQISKTMANAFISGKDSERQTAGVKSTLSNALKKISTKHIFMVLSADEIPLNINHSENPALICLVNNPKYETAYSPVIASIMHTITKQMSVRRSLIIYQRAERNSKKNSLNWK